jgi:phosphoribosylaminoimidazole-succinocarboxamide synthase
MNNYHDIISKNLDYTLSDTDVNLPNKKIGKVRDYFVLNDKMVLVTTDRQSAFDRVLACVPYKGQVLNQTSLWWFDQTRHIVPNHVVSTPDQNVVVGKKLTIFPVEIVVRAYMTGTTSTSIWTNYKNGVRDYCGNKLVDGMVKNQKLPKPIITPTTKSDVHDELVSPEQIIAKGLMTKDQFDYVSQKALEVFEFASSVAIAKGLILVDTKFEFGYDSEGVIYLADEILTPDSSRYWQVEGYEKRLQDGLEPQNIDKEFLRLWFVQNSDPYNDKILPDAPKDLIIELSNRYINLYEMITSEKFVFPDASTNINLRINKNLQSLNM